jgi:hypothetical protein
MYEIKNNPLLGNTLPKIMILAPMCSLNDLGPGFTLEAEPIIGLMLNFLAQMAILRSKY